MERAGARGGARTRCSASRRARWTVVCGGGSNGGDGRIAARHLERRASEVRVVERRRARPSSASRTYRRRAVRHRLPRRAAAEARRADRADQREPARACLAVDMPSGVDASTGEVAGAAVARRRDGHLPRPQGRARRRARPLPRRRSSSRTSGSSTRETEHRLAPPEILRSSRASASGDNKYTPGHVLVVGGSRGLTGAASLAARAAIRADAGYVTVAAPASTLPALEKRLLEAVKRPLRTRRGRAPAADAVLELAAKASARRARPGARARRRAEELVARARRDGPAGRRGRGRALRARAGRRLGAARADAAQGELAGCSDESRRGSPRTGSRACAMPSSASAASSLLKGADTLVAAPGRGVLVVRARPAVARDGGNRRRADGDRRRIPRQGDGRRSSRGGRRGRAAARARRGAAARGLVASDVIEALPRGARTRCTAPS